MHHLQTWLETLWHLVKLALEVLLIDFLAEFFDGYRNARYRQAEALATQRRW